MFHIHDFEMVGGYRIVLMKRFLVVCIVLFSTAVMAQMVPGEDGVAPYCAYSGGG